MSAAQPEQKFPDISPAARRVRLALALVIAAAAPVGAQSRPESAPATRAGTIIGQVLMPDGKPAAGATVKVFRPRLPSLPPALCAVLPEADHDEEYRVTCDGNGHFTAPARAGEVHGLLATDGGELMSAFANWLCAGDSAVLRLGPTRVIAGTVVVPEGGKASMTVGRRVCADLQDVGPRSWARAPVARLETRSGPGGAWSLRVPLGETPSIRVVDEEQFGGRTLAIGREDGGPIEIAPRRIRRGTLIDKADGTPVAGARVQWRDSAASDCVVSDREGRFALPELGFLGVLHVIPRTHERTFWAPRSLGVEVFFPDAVEAKIELTPAGTRMTGRLLREDGSPLGGARVVFAGPVHSRSREVSDLAWVDVLPADGRLEVRCLQRGQMIMGFVEVDGTFVQFVAARPTEDLAIGDLKVSVRGRIEGTVVAPDGSPMARAIVMVHARMQPADAHAELLPGFEANARVTVADRAGRFALDGLVPGPCWVQACAPGIMPTTLATTASAEPTPVVLRLERGQTLAGRVLDADGRPIAGRRVQVTFMTRLNEAGGRVEVRFMTRVSSPWSNGLRVLSTILPAVTDERGAFLFQGLVDQDRLAVQVLPARRGGWGSVPIEGTVGADVELVLSTQR